MTGKAGMEGDQPMVGEGLAGPQLGHRRPIAARINVLALVPHG